MRNILRTGRLPLGFVALWFLKPCSVLAGDEIIVPVSVSASTTWAGVAGYVSPQYLIDGSGLTGTGREATHTNASADHLFWHSDVPVTVAAQWIEFDLGAAYNVSNALIWQLDQQGGTSRGVQWFTISVAGTNHSFSTCSAYNFLEQATDLPQTPAQVVPLLAQNIRYVRFEVHMNWGADGIVGLGEVRFEGGAPEPPATDTILLPVAAAASSFYDYLGHYTPQWLTDGSGLTGVGRQATHSNANGWDLFWHSDGNGVAGQWVEFDLGAAYDVTNALVWQLAQQGFLARGVAYFTLSVAGPDHVYSTYSQNNLLAQATGAPEEPVQVFPLAASNIRYIKLEIQSNYGDQYVGLSEVRFEVAVPELSADEVVTLTPSRASASTAYPYLGYYEAPFMIDGSGLTGTGRRATHSNADGAGLFWNSDIGIVTSEQWAEFDLGAVYDVKSALIWQLAVKNATKTGVKAFAIKIAGPDHAFSTYSTDNTLNQGSDQPEQFPRVLPLLATCVRYVRFEIQSNWGRTDHSVGLSEVRFEVAPPETNAFIRIPFATDVSSSYVDNPKQHMIDGSGLAGTGLTATHANGLGQTSMWLSDYGQATNEWVEFDLGAELRLVSAAIWQYNQTVGSIGNLTSEYVKRGIKRMTIYTAGNDKNYAEYGSVSLDRALGLVAEPVQLVSLKADRARYVKFAVNATWGEPGMTGLSEVRFLYKRTGTLFNVH